MTMPIQIGARKKLGLSLIQIGLTENAEQVIDSIEFSKERDFAQRSIVDYYINTGNIYKAGIFNGKILSEKRKNIGWHRIAEKIGKQNYCLALNICDSNFELKSTREKVKKHITKMLDVFDINSELVFHSLKEPELEFSSIEHILQTYALDQLFFSELPQVKLERYNRSLNLQWAIDIKKQVPN